MMFDLTYWTAISGYFTLLTYAEELHCTKVCCADVAYHRRRYNAGTMKARSWKPTRRHVSRSFQHRTLLVCRQTTTLSGLNWHRQQRAAFVSIYCTASHCHSHCHSRLRISRPPCSHELDAHYSTTVYWLVNYFMHFCWPISLAYVTGFLISYVCVFMCLIRPISCWRPQVFVNIK